MSLVGQSNWSRRVVKSLQHTCNNYPFPPKENKPSLVSNLLFFTVLWLFNIIFMSFLFVYLYKTYTNTSDLPVFTTYDTQHTAYIVLTLPANVSFHMDFSHVQALNRDRHCEWSARNIKNILITTNWRELKWQKYLHKVLHVQCEERQNIWLAVVYRK